MAERVGPQWRNILGIRFSLPDKHHPLWFKEPIDFAKIAVGLGLLALGAIGVLIKHNHIIRGIKEGAKSY